MRKSRSSVGAVDRSARLLAEFLGLYVLVPALIAFFLPARMMFPALFGFTGLGLVMLHRTPGFTWAELVRGFRSVPWGQVAGFALAAGLVSWGVIRATRPEAAFALARSNPALLAMIFALYPILSALPQELIFRPLFFRRYGALLPGGRVGIVLNGAVFSFAHLMYWNWVVAAMTFAGGMVFASAYLHRGFPLAVILHSVAGWAVFALGLGVFFYSGNVVRPF
jgi:uncharacterized protein